MSGRKTPPASDSMRHILSVLAHLGWGLSRLPAPGPLKGASEPSLRETEWLALPLPDGTTLLCAALPFELPDLRQSFEHYEDLALVHRQILRGLDSAGVAGRYALLVGGEAAHLIDRPAEDILVTTSTREEAGDRLYPLLDFQALSRGSLSSFPRKPLRRRARELADWTHLWSARIGSELELTVQAMQGFFEWLHLARLADVRHIGPVNGSFRDSAGEMNAHTIRRFIDERFRLLHGTWNFLQGDSNAQSNPGILRSIDDSVLTECISSYALLSSSKFASDVFAEALADEEMQHLSWKSSVTADTRWIDGDENNGDALLNSTVRFELDRQGCSQLLRCFDTLANAVRIDAIDRESARERGERPGLQLDLLTESPGDINPREAARHVLRRMLRVNASNTRHATLARTILLARACEWHSAHGVGELPFPRVSVAVSTTFTSTGHDN